MERVKFNFKIRLCLISVKLLVWHESDLDPVQYVLTHKHQRVLSFQTVQTCCLTSSYITVKASVLGCCLTELVIYLNSSTVNY